MVCGCLRGASGCLTGGKWSSRGGGVGGEGGERPLPLPLLEKRPPSLHSIVA